VSVTVAISRWLETKSGNRSVGLERRRLELHVAPFIGDSDLRTVTRAQLSALLHTLAYGANAKPVEANRTYTSLRGFFRWCRSADLRDDDPTELLEKPTKEEPSARRRREEIEPLLDMDELARLWNSAPAIKGSILPDLLRCLLLVPLRREEMTGLAWAEVREAYVGDGWRGAALALPAARMKGGRPAVVPLSAAFVEILAARRKMTAGTPYVFAFPGREKPFAGWRHGTEAIRAALGSRTDWSPHTIRKSVATALVRDLGAEELLVGRILQHSVRSALGVTAVYQRSSRLAEQSALLTKWADHLQAVAAKVAQRGSEKDGVASLQLLIARSAP
jgi:integrase